MHREDDTILSQLEELAGRVGIKIRYEPLKIDGSIHMGGFCRIKGEDFLIVNNKATQKEKIYLLIDALKRCDMSDIYVMPSLRKILDIPDDQ